MGNGDTTSLSVTTIVLPNARRLEVVGEIDFGNASSLREPLTLAVEDPKVQPVVVDLRRVVFMDSAGLAALADAHRALIARGRRLQVVLTPWSQPERAMRLAGFVEVLDITYDAGPEAPSAGEAAAG